MRRRNRQIVICKLPKAGLGNQLFPLMKAYVYGHLHQLEVAVINYHQFKIGPYLRREKTKRNYSKFFCFQKSIIAEWLDTLFLMRRKRQIIFEPRFEEVFQEGDHFICFRDIPHWSNFFDQLAENRSLVIKLLHDIIHPEIKKKLDKLEPPVIGVHIRMGDFRKLTATEDFSKVGAVRTPERYFVDMIQAIRKMHGTELPVSIFTDGYKHEFTELLLLKNIRFVEDNNDITDLLLLSRSRIIVASAGSTFSYWAGFLSDVPFIMHPDHIHKSMRPTTDNGSYYDNAFNDKDPFLINYIQSIE